MTTENTQIQYDILLTKIISIAIFTGLIVSVFHAQSIYVLLLQISSVIGVFCLMGYLFMATMFLNACSVKNDTLANRFKMAATCFQWASALMSSVVTILLTII